MGRGTRLRGHCVRASMSGQEAPKLAASRTQGQLCSPACGLTGSWRRAPQSKASSLLVSTWQRHSNDGKYLHTAPAMGCLDHLATGCGKCCQHMALPRTLRLSTVGAGLQGLEMVPHRPPRGARGHLPLPCLWPTPTVSLNRLQVSSKPLQ